MDILKILGLIGIYTAIGFTACNTGGANTTGNSDNSTIIFNLKDLKHIGTVDERYQSYNIEMVEVVGGRFWKPYSLMDSLPSSGASTSYDISQKNDQMYRLLSPVNLTDKRLMNLAKGLAPAYVRVSGTWANAIYFQDDDEPKITKAPAGFVFFSPKVTKTTAAFRWTTADLADGYIFELVGPGFLTNTTIGFVTKQTKLTITKSTA